MEDSAIAKGGEHGKWTIDSIDARRKLKMAVQFNPWSQLHPRLHGVPQSARMRDVLNVGFWKLRLMQKHKENGELIHGAYCNLQQSVGRMPVTVRQLQCFDTNDIFFSYQKDTVFP